MQILILSHTEAENLLPKNSNEWDVVCITNSDSLVPQEIQRFSKSYVHLIFDDIDYPFGNFVPPSKNDVKTALDFSAGKEKIIVMCHGGISRSAAIAYAIMCKQCGSPREAILILTPVKHYPNRIVVKHASDILEDKSVYDIYQEWLQKPFFITPCIRS